MKTTWDFEKKGMNKTQARRLEKLIAYLEQPNYPKEFNFNHFKLENDDDRNSDCGTSGCALGDCPTLFPKQWHFYQGVPALKGRGSAYMSEAYYSAARFFGMTELESSILFKPVSYALDEDERSYVDVNGYRIFGLPLLATRFDVALNLRKYLRAKSGVTLK